MSGTLYVIGTPIGNLEDMTLRQLRMLQEVDFIAAEDTRVTRKLLSHYDIHTPMVSYHDHSGQLVTQQLLQRIAAGETCGIVTDAGMPCISDPGEILVRCCKEQGIPVSMVMFQNESWSYTNYPGCAWTPEGIIRFNVEYLAPTLKKRHPEVKVYLGTINTNRYDIIDQVLSDLRMPETIQGVGFQWEGGQILPRLRAKYPQYKYVQTESECGWGSFDWKAAEHTFGLMNHYLGNGCEEYTFWNAILYDGGFSGWGWKQNALIHVDSKAGTATYTPEYYAVKHYSHYITPGSKILSYKAVKDDKTPVMIVMTPQKKQVVIAGNFNGEAKEVTVKLGNRYLCVTLQAHSLNTFVEK